jgi:hypothetical protein
VRTRLKLPPFLEVTLTNADVRTTRYEGLIRNPSPMRSLRVAEVSSPRAGWTLPSRREGSGC